MGKTAFNERVIDIIGRGNISYYKQIKRRPSKELTEEITQKIAKKHLELIDHICHETDTYKENFIESVKRERFGYSKDVGDLSVSPWVHEGIDQAVKEIFRR